MSFQISNFQTIQNQQSIPTPNLALDCQNSIKHGDIGLLKELKDQGLAFNQALPNGQIPLHFAICLNDPKVALALLKLGAEPEIEDSQGLSAIDHAKLMKNDYMLAIILGYKIGEEIEEVQGQIKCKSTALHVDQLKSNIQKISTVNVQNLSPLNKAAYQGNLIELTQLLNSKSVNEFDDNGLTPIHYAILGNQIPAFNKLVELGAKIDMTTSQEDSLLHFAAISDSSQFLSQLVSLGLNLNHKNSKGATALHYAAVKNSLANFEFLIKKGANFRLLDQEDLSPLALIGAHAFQKDPLSLSKAQIALFGAAFCSCLTALALDYKLDFEDKIGFLFYLTAVISSEFPLLQMDFTTATKKILALTAGIGLTFIPPFSVAIAGWSTYHVARSAFTGLKNCWKNVGYRNFEVARNVVMLSTSTALSAAMLYAISSVSYEVLKEHLI